MNQEIKKTKFCRFCKIVQDMKKGNKQASLENTVLFEGDNFFVIPALGPLLKGHILIVSKKHFDCLGSMEKSAISEYNDLVSKLMQKRPLKNNDFLEFEHGSKGESAAGASIVHCHIHVLPGLGYLHDILDDKLPRISLADDFASMSLLNLPHIWLRNASMQVKLYLAEDLPSQFLRRKISYKLGHNKWDWRKYPRRKWVKNIVAEWLQDNNEEK